MSVRVQVGTSSTVGRGLVPGRMLAAPRTAGDKPPPYNPRLRAVSNPDTHVSGSNEIPAA